jgi:TfoX/Sxy family transcriptional regulator of competence genes
MVHDPKQLQGIMAEAAPDVELSFRSMFGGVMVYAAGKPLATLSDSGLALKVFGGDHATLLALPGASRWQYDPGKPAAKNYVVVPEAMLKDAELLRGWIVRAAAGLPVVKQKKVRK